MSEKYIGGFAHVNLNVPPGTLALAREFYDGVLGLTVIPVPAAQRDVVAWFDCGNGEQLHISHPWDPSFPLNPRASHHPCFRVLSADRLEDLKGKIYKYMLEGRASSPKEADQPGAPNSGAQGPEFPQRFFCRDFAGNRLEFTL